MKKINVIISLIISVVIFSSCGNNTETADVNNNDTTNVEANNVKEVLTKDDVTYSGRIAYIRTDSLLLNYKFHKIITEKFINKTNRLDKELKDKGAKFQKDANDFQVKQQNGAFLSQESFQAQGTELQKREQELYSLNDRYTMELAQEKETLDKQIEDSVNNVIEIFNKDANYDFILNKAFVLYGRKGFDITDTITAILNARYDNSIAKTEE
jgi:outer membrane protein